MTDNLGYPAVQDYLLSLLPKRRKVMMEMEQYAQENDFPIIHPAVGQLCYLITSMISAEHIFEMGSGYGYSTAWFARALAERYEIIPGEPGLVHHVVWEEDLSRQAKKYLRRMGYQDYVEYHVGDALEVIEEFDEETFDLIFCDIDKEAYPNAVPVMKEKLRPGGVLLIDNMLWYGRIFDENDKSPSTKGVRKFTRQIKSDRDWIVSLLPVGDGVIVAYKNDSF